MENKVEGAAHEPSAPGLPPETRDDCRDTTCAAASDADQVSVQQGERGGRDGGGDNGELGQDDAVSMHIKAGDPNIAPLSDAQLRLLSRHINSNISMSANANPSDTRTGSLCVPTMIDSGSQLDIFNEKDLCLERHREHPSQVMKCQSIGGSVVMKMIAYHKVLNSWVWTSALLSYNLVTIR